MIRWRFTLNPDTDNKEIAEPKGWTELTLTLKRDDLWHGVFFEYSGELGFYNNPTNANQDAYTFIRDEYELQGVEGFVLLEVEMACNDTDEFEREAVWRLNFSSYKETRGAECFVSLNLEPENCLMTFKNRYDQPVTFSDNLSYNGTDLGAYTYLGFNLTLPPKTILQQANLNSPGFVGADGNSHPTVTVNHTISAALGGTVTKEGIGYFQFGLNPGPGTAYDAADGLDEITTRNPISDGSDSDYSNLQMNYNILIGGTYTFSFIIQGRISATVTTNANNTDCSGDEDTFNYLGYEIYIKAGATTDLIYSASDSGCFNPTKEFTSIPMGGLGIGLTYTLNAGDEVQIYVRVRAEGTWNHPLIGSRDVSFALNFDGSASMDVIAYTLSEETTTKASLINEVGSRILEKTTDDCLRLLSNYYGRTDSQPYPAPNGETGIGGLRALMAGLDIRQYTSGRLSLSFKQLFEGLNAIDYIGIGLESDTNRVNSQVVRMEPAAHFYDPEVILTLDKIPLVVIEVITSLHYSIYKGGYNKWEAEEYFGLDEFATDRNYRTELTSTKNTLDRVCSFIASGYAIEITRRQKLYNATTAIDWRFDNDTFIVCLNPKASGIYTVEQGNITAAANIIDPTTLYNFRISPTRNALRWLSAILNSYRDPTATASAVIFTDGKGNILAEGLMTGDGIVEAATITENQTLGMTSRSDPADALPVFVPEAWRFEYPITLSQYGTLKLNSTKTIRARFGQDTDFYSFYLKEIEVDPNRGMGKWTLLPHRLYPIDECLIYIVQARGSSSTSFGSALLVGAELENLFIFVNGELMKYNDENAANNEVDSWNSATGYGELTFPIPEGAQVSIFHLPPGDGRCDTCIHRFEGRGDGTTTPTLTGLGSATLSTLFVFYNGQLMKYKDLNAANNEITAYNSMSEELTFNGATHPKRELRAFAFANCANIKTFSGNGDGTTTPTVSGLGLGDLSNIFVFYNGQLMKYNDSNTDNNEVTAYNAGTAEVTFNFPTHAARELRAFKLQN